LKTPPYSTFTAFVPINPNKPANYEATASVE